MIVVVPLQPAGYVTAPVAAIIVIPPVILAASKAYVIPVELFAVVVVVTVPAPWQRVEVAGENAFIVTVGVIVTTGVVVAGPLHPAALAVIVVVPLQPATYVKAPVAVTILLPAPELAASMLYIIPVELFEVVVVVTVPAP